MPLCWAVITRIEYFAENKATIHHNIDIGFVLIRLVQQKAILRDGFIYIRKARTYSSNESGAVWVLAYRAKFDSGICS